MYTAIMFQLDNFTKRSVFKSSFILNAALYQVGIHLYCRLIFFSNTVLGVRGLGMCT